MFQDFLLRKMLKGQGVPDDQIDMVLSIFQKDPALFKKIAEEIQAEVKSGKNQQAASMGVMQKYQDQLKGLMGK